MWSLYTENKKLSNILFAPIVRKLPKAKFINKKFLHSDWGRILKAKLELESNLSESLPVNCMYIRCSILNYPGKTRTWVPEVTKL